MNTTLQVANLKVIEMELGCLRCSRKWFVSQKTPSNQDLTITGGEWRRESSGSRGFQEAQKAQNLSWPPVRPSTAESLALQVPLQSVSTRSMLSLA